MCAHIGRSQDSLRCLSSGSVHIVVLRQGLLLAENLPSRLVWLLREPQDLPVSLFTGDGSGN